ncbi:MAG: Rrf2 family transcriptional regulator [Erysipelotrichaceae bacterium]|nr:Rrf2 family transcriptional regulator [Erysipelotrichaceae bacterium]MDY6035500.1 Rrf2 family transcriptional regulator [Bulleidia sp.]
MQVSSKFTIAIHILTAIAYFKDTQKETSSSLAGSIGANPVIVRNVMGKLKEAGIIHVSQGQSGIKLAKDVEDISLYDIYHAVENIEETGLFRFHENPNANCPVGRNIHVAVDPHLIDAQEAMETSLKSVSLKTIVDDTNNAIISE